ncbi:MAG: NAD-dependent epimerase/dehydratase family protein [Dehalococcoidia bacterium]
MRVLVSGSSGFVGSHLVRWLVNSGHEVTGLDKAEPRRPLPPGTEGWRDVRADILDEPHVARVMQEVRPEVVFHLAAQVSVSVSMREPKLDIETNVIGTVNLARHAAEAGARRFVNTSSGGAMFGQPDVVPTPDGTPTEPLSFYGTSKAAAELYLGLIERQTGLSVASVRPSNIYGPWQDPHGEAGVVAIFARRMLRDEEVTVFAPGTDTRDYVYVGDVVDAMARAAMAERGEMCVIGTGVETSTLELFRAMARETGYAQEPVMGPQRPGDIPRSALDARKAQAVWGWAPRVALAEGLRLTVDAFREELA